MAKHQLALRSRELWIVAAAILALMVIQLALAGGAALLTRPLWLDEYHTILVASQSTPVGVISDLAHGGDYAPPLLHLLTWTERVVAGEVTPALLRATSMLCVWLALVCTYAGLRRQFSPPSSLAGTLAVASHSLVVAHAYEGRFYGPWLLFAAAFALGLGSRNGRQRDVAIALLAVAICMINWLGVMSLGLMCASVAALGPGSLRDRTRLLAPASAGLIALLICAPLVAGQRAALSVATWVPDLNEQQITETARTYFVALVPLSAGVLLLAGLLRQHAKPDPRLAGRAYSPSIIAFSSLALMPVVMAAFSVVVQPAMLPRYSIVAALWWAPLVAFATSRVTRTPALAFCGLLVVVGYVNVSSEAREKRLFAQRVQADVAAFDWALTTGLPIVFQARHVMYPVATQRRPQMPRAALLELPDSTIDAMYPPSGPYAWLRRFFRVERDVALAHARLYAFPRLAPTAQLAILPRFILVATGASLPGGYKDAERFVATVLPTHRAVRLSAEVTLVDRLGR